MKVLYCHCAYARVVPDAVKQEVLLQLASSDLEFEAVPDLCEMSARKDPRLPEFAVANTQIIACYPRAVCVLCTNRNDAASDAQFMHIRLVIRTLTNPRQLLADQHIDNALAAKAGVQHHHTCRRFRHFTDDGCVCACRMRAHRRQHPLRVAARHHRHQLAFVGQI